MVECQHGELGEERNNRVDGCESRDELDSLR